MNVRILKIKKRIKKRKERSEVNKSGEKMDKLACPGGSMVEH
jgi:hypothetical protein